MRLINNLTEIIGNYNYFIVDIWGVIHDGSAPYPNVIETLKYLRDNNKKIGFLSNAPRRSAKVKDVLAKFGVTPDLYDFVFTSGESAYEDLELNASNNYDRFGKKYLYIGPHKDLDLLEGLDYERVDNPAEASFVINTGFDHDNSQLSEKLPIAIQANNFKLPMLCINPDLIVVKQNGQEMLCAGALAREYQKIGGKVFYYGKPYSKVYEDVLKKFSSPSKEKIVAIGDGLETDIKGANDFKIDNVLISGGILVKELDIEFWQNPDEDKIKKICNNYKIFPNYIISNLKI